MADQVRDLVDELTESLSLSDVESLSKEKLARYIDLLLEGLQKLRLTGEKGAEGIVWQQIYDSIYILKLTKLDPWSRVVDLGSGAGLPGVPLKICRPDLELFLMDSNRKKARFLNEVIEKLDLHRAYVLCGRAEEYGQNSEHREKYEVVLSKAVAEAPTLAELALPLLREGGRAIFYKGPRGKKEIQEAEQAIKNCGGELSGQWTYSLKSGEQRLLFEVRKTAITPPKYPRRAGVPAKKPLK